MTLLTAGAILVARATFQQADSLKRTLKLCYAAPTNLSNKPPVYLTLELPHQSNWLILQFYFKIPTSCYIFSPQWCNDFRNDN